MVFIDEKTAEPIITKPEQKIVCLEKQVKLVQFCVTYEISGGKTIHCWTLFRKWPIHRHFSKY